MQYKALLFDLDGTLLDTLQDLAETGNKVLAAKGLPIHPLEGYRLFVGDGLQSLIEAMLPAQLREEKALVNQLMADFSAEYAQNWRQHSRPYPGIAELLDQLEGAGYRLCILSNKPQRFTQLCVEQLLTKWRFYPIFGQREGVPKKPHPAAALEAASLLHLPASQILYVGDSAVDMRTAQQAGMDAVGVLWGLKTAQELHAAGASRLIHHPDELWRWLASPSSSPLE